MRPLRRLSAVLAVAVCVLPGCTSGDGSAGRAPLPLPAAAPPGPSEPRALIALRAAVDLSPAVPGRAATATAAVASPDGGAYVVLGTPDLGLPHYLATVA